MVVLGVLPQTTKGPAWTGGNDWVEPGSLFAGSSLDPTNIPAETELKREDSEA
jgi:hypothetical protein